MKAPAPITRDQAGVIALTEPRNRAQIMGQQTHSQRNPGMSSMEENRKSALPRWVPLAGIAAIAAIGAESISLPAGAEIIATGATATALTVAIRDADGEALLVYDLNTGRLIDRVPILRPR